MSFCVPVAFRAVYGLVRVVSGCCRLLLVGSALGVLGRSAEGVQVSSLLRVWGAGFRIQGLRFRASFLLKGSCASLENGGDGGDGEVSVKSRFKTLWAPKSSQLPGREPEAAPTAALAARNRRAQPEHFLCLSHS